MNVQNEVPKDLLQSFAFKTDLKSMLRGLNSLLGIGMGPRSRLRSVRVASDKTPMIIASNFDLVKFILTADKLPDSAKALKYDESHDSYEFSNSLTGDPKEVLFIFEDIDVVTYSKALLNKNSLKENAFHFYSDELSALLDSYQINNGLVFLFHGSDNSLYILNRALSPDPDNDSRFFFYTKIFALSNGITTGNTNFIEINRFDLSIKSHTELSGVDLGQMILPVIHLQHQ